MIRPWMLAAATTLALAACSPQKAENQPAAPPAPTEVKTPATPAPAPTPEPGTGAPEVGETIGGDGSEIQLSGLTAADLQSNKLEGELGCSFRADGPDPLVVAMGVVGSKDPAFGLVKVGSYVERIAAPGGFDGMIKGATFSGQGKTVTIKVTGPAKGGGESPPNPATLTYDRADGAKRVWDGTWTCGP